jgi:RND family efflux transporter MFP subunit
MFARITSSWRRARAIGLLAGLALAWWLTAPDTAAAQTNEIDGLTEPFRTVDVAATEPGLIMKMFVREGDAVRQGQPLAALDSDVYAAMLAIAKQAMESQGNLQSALADVQLKRDRLAKFEALRAADHAREEELERARAELTIAEARLLAVREELEVRRLEFEKAKVQFERRTIRSPIDGIVTKAHKDEGEYVAPNDPIVCTVVQLNSLIATFSVPAPRARGLKADRKVKLRFADSEQPAEGAIEFVSPVTDAESGTVRVKVRLDNATGAYRSGERCTLDLSERPPAITAGVAGPASPKRGNGR